MRIEERFQKNYRESLIQWIWQETAFESADLRTVCDKIIKIIDPGLLNHGGGPDFLNAKLIIDGLQWFGSVEIHTSAKDWIRHGHHRDAAYENVILHVVYEHKKGQYRVTRSDGTEPYTLELKNFISEPLSRLIRHKNSEKDIPCHGKTALMNQTLFEEQLEKVSSEYFEYKVNELLAEFEHNEDLFLAWKRALTIQIYKLLGIPANIIQMKILAQQLTSFDVLPTLLDENKFLENILSRAFREMDPMKKIDWVSSGMRPASRPKKRVIQAAAIHFQMIRRDLDYFMKNPKISWKGIEAEVSQAHRPGEERMNVIKNTVYIPAIYLLGRLKQDDVMMNLAFGGFEKP